MDNKPSLTSLDNLLARISNALRSLPGAQALYLFGSAADPARKDRYSDLDLQVISSQFELSRAAWPAVLSRVGKLALVFQLDPDDPAAQETAFTLGFEGQSFYHKVDFGITDWRLSDGYFNQLEGKVLLWQQEALAEPLEAAPQTAWRPVWDSPGHFLLGELLSSVRYTKARKRRQHLTCWRFLSAKFNALLRCTRWQQGVSQFPPVVRTTWDFTALDRQLSEDECLGLLSGLKTASPPEMDRSLVEITGRIAALIDPDYNKKDTHQAALVREMLGFIQNELVID